jgi:hypothetical protein
MPSASTVGEEGPDVSITEFAGRSGGHAARSVLANSQVDDSTAISPSSDRSSWSIVAFTMRGVRA